MSYRTSIVFCAGLMLAACGGNGSKTDGGGAPDMKGTAGDMAQTPGDMAQTSGDMAHSATQLTVYWQLLSANLQSGTHNGFSTNCDEVPATQIQFAVTNAASANTFTTVACPDGMHDGQALIDLPDATGPWTVDASLVGVGASKSEVVRDVGPGDAITVRIYAQGCDAPACQ